MGVTPGEVGGYVAGRIFVEGPRALCTIYGLPLLWGADELEVVGKRATTTEDRERLAQQATREFAARPTTAQARPSRAGPMTPVRLRELALSRSLRSPTGSASLSVAPGLFPQGFEAVSRKHEPQGVGLPAVRPKLAIATGRVLKPLPVNRPK